MSLHMHNRKSKGYFDEFYREFKRRVKGVKDV